MPVLGGGSSGDAPPPPAAGPSPPPSMHVHVRVPQFSQPLRVEVRPATDRVQDLKARVVAAANQQRESTSTPQTQSVEPWGRCRLIRRGGELRDDVPLATAGLVEGEHLHAMLAAGLPPHTPSATAAISRSGAAPSASRPGTGAGAGVAVGASQEQPDASAGAAMQNLQREIGQRIALLAQAVQLQQRLAQQQQQQPVNRSAAGTLQTGSSSTAADPRAAVASPPAEQRPRDRRTISVQQLLADAGKELFAGLPVGLALGLLLGPAALLVLFSVSAVLTDDTRGEAAQYLRQTRVPLVPPPPAEAPPPGTAVVPIGGENSAPPASHSQPQPPAPREQDGPLQTTPPPPRVPVPARGLLRPEPFFAVVDPTASEAANAHHHYARSTGHIRLKAGVVLGVIINFFLGFFAASSGTSPIVTV